MQVAYVIGAGFSRSLGGPLLDDLLSPFVHEKVKHRYHEYKEILSELPALHDCYDYEKVMRTRQGGPQILPWVNAEQYLAWIDAARQNETSFEAKFLRSRPGSGDFGRRALCARRYLCCACSEFLPEEVSTIRNDERWGPYLRWARQLQSKDTVICLNYDRVAELASMERGHPVGANLVRWLPKPDEEESEGAARLLMLHGSVDWATNPGREEVARFYDVGAIFKNRYEPVIVAPGPSKQGFVRKQFGPLWNAAEQALSEADTIVFLGYSFPLTDSYARERLLNAIRRNKKSPPIRIVLGHDERGQKDAIRVRSLVEWACRRRHGVEKSMKDPCVEIVPMYAEDFLSVFDREELF